MASICERRRSCLETCNNRARLNLALLKAINKKKTSSKHRVKLRIYCHFNSGFYTLQPCHTCIITTHSSGKTISVVLPAFPREIHGCSPRQLHLEKAKASDMMPLREEFYSWKQAHQNILSRPTRIPRLLWVTYLCIALRLMHKAYERDPKCCSKASLVSMLAMLLMAKS